MYIRIVINFKFYVFFDVIHSQDDNKKKSKKENFHFHFFFNISRASLMHEILFDFYLWNKKKNSQFLASWCGNPKIDAWKIIKLNKIDAIIFIVNAFYGNFFSYIFDFLIFYCISFSLNQFTNFYFIICSQPDEFFFQLPLRARKNKLKH